MSGERRGGKDRKPRPPLNREKLQALALHYVGRYATTRARLGDYLRRKVRERGWSGELEPPVEELVRRLAEQGYIDDAAFALMKSRSLVGRGYGASRVRQSLRAAGIDEIDGEAALDLADEERVEAALRFARRRRIGPYADSRPDPAAREKALAALLRAGHPFALAKAIVSLEPGSEPDLIELTEKAA